MRQTRRPNPDFWHGKKVLVTGHTGFKGAWLCHWLVKLGANVIGISLPPDTDPSLFNSSGISDQITSIHCDIRNHDKFCEMVRSAKPEIAFHLAAQSLVLQSYETPQQTFDVNIMGTVNLLMALKDMQSFKSGVVVTSDKVYRNHGRGVPFAEGDELGGNDPYSSSKAACEIVVASMRASFFKTGAAIATARAGNVIGGGDWAGNRIVPDAIRAWNSGAQLVIRNPDAVRPWQHVLEPLAGYLMLAESLWSNQSFATAFNFGPDIKDCVAVRSLIERAQSEFGKGEFEFSAPHSGPQEAALLTLDASLARAELNIAPQWSLETAVAKTMTWYKKYYEGKSATSLCLADIAAYGQSHGPI
jgi:CDP-glucose 4,6-dehydratase